MDISLPLAFGAGILSFFSPCVLPMIPAYIMYITGVSTEEELDRKKFLAISRTLGFVIGFTIIFMIMGSSATVLGKIFIRNKNIFSKISGGLIILFGLNMLGIIDFKFLNRVKRISTPRITSWISPLFMGMAFAAGWTPCFGPVLASILFYASGAGAISEGSFLLFIYSLGMAIPFILTAFFINLFDKFLRKTNKYLKYVNKIGGLILVIFGLLVFFDKVINISNLLL